MLYQIIFSFLLTIYVLFSNGKEAYTYPQNYFSFPIKGKIDLTGNFGEVRANHFHTGIDLRTGIGQKGIEVYASADGYIGRINISSRGYGKALYIVHSNGYTTVYGHLNDFQTSIKSYAEQYQYEKQLYETEIFPQKNLLKVKKGDLIAFSGNSGGSAGPHLHFEIRDTKTEEIINPLLFGLKINDIIKPEIKSIILYKLDSKNKHQNGVYDFVKFNKSKHSLMPGKGVFAIGLVYHDLLRNNGFGMGIYSIKLYVNNIIYLEQKIEKFKFTDLRMVNCNIDYTMFDQEETKVIKLFIDDGNKLNIYPVAKNQGKIFLKNNDKLKIKIVISDYSKNKDSVSFMLKGGSAIKDELPIEHYPISLNSNYTTSIFYPEKFNTIQHEANGETVKVDLPVGVLYDTVLSSLGVKSINKEGKQIWQILSSNIPLDDKITISFKSTNYLNYLSKAVIVGQNKNGKIKAEKTFTNGNLISANVKNTGNFYLTADTTKPTISNLKIDENHFSVMLSDDLSGVKEYYVKIDSNWVLAYFEPKENTLEGKIPDFVKCGIHNFSIKVVDFCSNEAYFTQTFTLNNCLKNMKLKTGDKAPQFTTKDQNGNTVNLSDNGNSKIVLYFYPKDDTPGCTAEACNLRDNYEMLLAKGYKIYGVSPDGITQHVKFREKYNLPFDLLTDENHAVAEAYGTWVEKSMYGKNYMGMARVTFIIENGLIADIIDKVDTKNHAEQILK